MLNFLKLLCAVVCIAVGVIWLTTKPNWEVVVNPDGSKIMSRRDAAGHTLEQNEYRADGSLACRYYEDDNYTLRWVCYDRE